MSSEIRGTRSFLDGSQGFRAKCVGYWTRRTVKSSTLQLFKNRIGTSKMQRPGAKRVRGLLQTRHLVAVLLEQVDDGTVPSEMSGADGDEYRSWLRHSLLNPP